MGHTIATDILLRVGVDIDKAVAEDQTALIAAAKFNRLGVVKRLLEDKVFVSEGKHNRVNNASSYGRTPISFAAGSGFIEIVRQLLQHDDIQPDKADSNQWTPFFWAVGGQHLDVLQLLLADDRTNIKYKDNTGRNALSWAAAEGELDLVKYLTSLKCLNVDDVDRNGRSAFSWAARSGHLETIISLRRD